MKAAVLTQLNKDVVEFLGILFDMEQDRLGFIIRTDEISIENRSMSSFFIVS